MLSENTQISSLLIAAIFLLLLSFFLGLFTLIPSFLLASLAFMHYGKTSHRQGKYLLYVVFALSFILLIYILIFK